MVHADHDHGGKAGVAKGEVMRVRRGPGDSGRRDRGVSGPAQDSRVGVDPDIFRREVRDDGPQPARAAPHVQYPVPPVTTEGDPQEGRFHPRLGRIQGLPARTHRTDLLGREEVLRGLNPAHPDVRGAADRERGAQRPPLSLGRSATASGEARATRDRAPRLPAPGQAPSPSGSRSDRGGSPPARAGHRTPRPRGAKRRTRVSPPRNV